ncbi:MAG: DUF1501 domain-containing protein [Myxococcaceae bacterium]
MNRRTLLKLLGLSVPALSRALAQPVRGRAKTLVTIFLRGGVDGLAMIQPTGDAALRSLRRSVLHEGPKLDAFFSLHPAMSSLKPLWDRKALAVVHAVGQAHPSRSHFEAQDFIESGAAGTKRSDGYLNRALTTVPGTSAFRAVALQSTLPLSLSGEADALAFPELAKFRVQGASGLGLSFEALYAGAVDEALRTGGQSAFESLNAVAGEAWATAPAQNGAVYPKGAFGQRLADLARLIRGDVGLRIGVTELGGFDTHLAQGGEKGQLANKLKELADGLAAFATDLGPKLEDVVVVTLTEFGRTAKENGTQGTDHGTASALFALGGGVRGGRVVADWPGLTGSQLYEGRDLAVTTDLRSVLWGAIEASGIEARAADVFPDFTPRPVALWG